MKEIELFLGRLNPPHNGHLKIIQSMKNPVVVIVKGGKTSQDKERNPLPVEYQKELIEKIAPNVEISISPNGFLPGILGYFRKQGKEVTTIYAGADRINAYKKSIDDANKKMPDDKQYKVTFKETERVTSASAVRKAIRDNDQDTFKKLCPKAIWGEWERLKTYLKLEESFNFQLFCEELTGVANIAQKEKPMKLIKRLRRKNVT